MAAEYLKAASQCTAKAKTTGNQCSRPAIPGGNVCRYHGGAAPQVKKKAEERLAALVDPALGVLQRALSQRKDLRLAVNAAQDVLDRNNLSGKHVVQLEVTSGLAVADVLREARRRRREQSTSTPTSENPVDSN